MKINTENTILLVIDIQTRLLPAMNESEQYLKNAEKLIEGCRILGTEIIATEQYPKGIGPTVDSVKGLLGDATVVAKTSFSCLAEREVADFLDNTGRKNVILCGIESHICVLQTALALKQQGYNPIVVADCVESRKAEDKKWGLMRMMQEGVTVSTYESVLYEMMEDSKHPKFKEISKLIK